MRKIAAIEFITLDGVIQSPGRPDEDGSGGFGYGGWISSFSDSVLSAFIRRQMDMPFDLLVGRKTFEIWESYWPEHGDIWPGVNSAYKYVVSHSRSSSEWEPSLFIKGDVVGEISDIKRQDGPELHVYGSAELMQLLMRNGLVDELRLMIFPITLGVGKRLFGEGTVPVEFKVTESAVSPSGVIIANYVKAGDFLQKI